MGLRREHFLLGFRFLVIVGLAPIIGWMLSRAWMPETIAWDTVYTAAAFFTFGEGTPIEMFPSFVLGLYIGLLVIFTADARKRYQGVLLVVGTAIALFTLAAEGTLLANISFRDPLNWIMFLIGAGLGIMIERRRLQSIVDGVGEVDIEELAFPRAAYGLFLFLAAIVTVGLGQTIVAGTSTPIIDVPASAAFVYMLFGFVQYNAQSNVQAVGPRESGKSLLLLALYLTFRTRQGGGGAEGHMNSLIRQADTMEPGNDFPIPNTPAYEQLTFNVTVGEFFPKRITLSVTDHTGEVFSALSQEMEESLGIRKRLDILKAKYERLHWGLEIGRQESFLLLEDRVRDADVVLLLLDVERLIEGDTNHVTELKTIGKRVRENGGEAIVVATKCDYLIEEFSGFSRVVDNPLGQGLEDEFTQKVNSKLRSELTSVDELVREVDADKIYPMYYETQPVEDGTGTEERLPELDEFNNLVHRGSDEIADQLEARL